MYSIGRLKNETLYIKVKQTRAEAIREMTDEELIDIFRQFDEDDESFHTIGETREWLDEIVEKFVPLGVVEAATVNSGGAALLEVQDEALRHMRERD